MKEIKCIRVLADEHQIRRCREEVKLVDEKFYSLAKILNMSGNASRLKILFLLSREKELCVCDLSDILKMNVSAVSQHLRKLKDAGMITFRRSGQTIYYSIDKEELEIISDIFISLKNTLKENLIAT